MGLGMSLLGSATTAAVVAAVLAVLAAAWTRNAAAGASRDGDSGKVRVGVSERHKFGDVRKGRLVELGWVENGILRISRDRGGAMKVGVVLRLKGPRLDRSTMERAWRALQRRHPVLRSRLVPEGNKFVMVEDPDADPPLVWRDRAGDDSLYLKVYAEEGPKPPPAGQLPHKVFLLEDDSVTDLFFVMDHFFCDGLSVVSVLRELAKLLDAYEANATAPAASAATIAGAEATGREQATDAIIGEPLAWQRPMELCIADSFSSKISQGAQVAWYLLRHLILEDKIVDFPVARADIKANEIWKKAVCTPVTITIGADVVKPLLANCRAQGCTLGSALAAATAYAARDVAQDRPGPSDLHKRMLNVALALDMRRRYTKTIAQEHLSYNISSTKGYMLRLSDAMQEGEIDGARLFARAKQMGDHYRSFDYAGLMFGTVMGGFFEQPPTYDRLATVAISNWGRLDFPETCAGRDVETLFGFPHNVHFRMPTLVCSSLHGRLTLTLQITEPVCSRETADAFLLAMRGYLERMAAET